MRTSSSRRHADRAAERHTLIQLLGDVFGQQESVAIDTLHLNDVDADLAALIADSFLDAAAQFLNAAA